jgi:nucleoside transporter
VTLVSFLMGSPHEGGLNLSARHAGLIYSTFSIAATISPLFVGLLADRLFASQRVLAVLHLIGAALLACMLWTSIERQTDVRAAFDRRAQNELFEPPGELPTRNLKQILDAIEAVEKPQNEFWRTHVLRRLPQPWLDTLGIDNDYLIRAQVDLVVTLMYTGLPSAIGPDLQDRIAAATQRVRTDPEVVAAAERAFPPLFALTLAYACFYAPTLTLSNSLTFRNLPDAARQYGPLRALGTVGWVVAGLFVGFAAPTVSPLPIFYAAVTAVLLAALCLFLPHTPPAGKPKTLGDALGLPALRMLADRSFLVYVLAAVLATTLMPFHNSFTNKFLVDLRVEHAAAVQTIAQPTEIAGTLLIPWLLRRWGVKWMLFVGLLASAVRFAAYATQSVPMVLGLALPLHGVGFSLFYIAAALYVDRQAPQDLRASAQGLVTLMASGAGGVFGNWLAGRVVESHTAGGVVDWGPVWLVPALGTLATAVMFALLFREPGRKKELATDEHR